MFADQIMTKGPLSAVLKRGFSDVVGLIATANKFVLSDEFVEAADALASDADQLARAMPFCRLPFSHCWFEFPSLSRSNWLERAKTNHIHQGPTISQADITRVGLLVTEKAGGWTLNLFWASRIQSINANPLTVTLAEAERGLREGRGPIACLQDKPPVVAADWARDYLAEVIDRVGVSDAQEFLRDCGSDWAGEVFFFFAALAVLNARNVVEQSFVDKTEHNEKRRRRGRPPLSSHYTLTVRPRIAALTKAGEGEDAGSTRAHFVRGHWKARKTGLFFWSPYMRGDLAKGYIHKDYRLQPMGQAQ